MSSAHSWSLLFFSCLINGDVWSFAHRLLFFVLFVIAISSISYTRAVQEIYRVYVLHVVFVDLDTLLELLVKLAETTDFGHNIATSPCKDFPLLCAFVCMCFKEVFVWLEWRKLKYFNLAVLQCATHQENYMRFIHSFNRRVNHAKLVLKSDRDESTEVEEGSTTKFAQVFVVGAGSFREY